MTDHSMTGKPLGRAVTVNHREFSAGGFGYGLRQEFVRAVVSVAAPPDMALSAVDAALSAAIPRSDADAGKLSTLPELLVAWTAELQRAAGQPVFDQGRVVGMGGPGRYVLALPAINVAAASEALLIVADLIADLLDGDVAEALAVEEARKKVDDFVARHASVRTGGSNTPHFLRAAYDRKLPWFRLTAEVFQIGMGSRARWLESTLTDVTPAVSMRLARSKIAAADVLRQAGLPVPRHELVWSAAEAVAAATRIGYPVVVKPADRDGGVAVAAGLADDAGVVQGYETAREASRHVMVEKHVDGRDYRLVVHDGRMIWALERVPGGVTGDGVSTVAQLVERLNQEPARAKRADAPLKPLVFDREAAELLAGYGMTLQSVPAAGDRVRLRRAANVATGGTPEAAFDRVHPDNARLAERAAAALRLDLAGIDLLISDISRSWKETGAAICEVNAQPTIGNTTSKHLYGQILNRLVQTDGRIPIAMVVGAGAGSPVPLLVGWILTAAGLRTAAVPPPDRPSDFFGMARAALINRDTDAMVVAISDISVLKSCLPFDRCTTIVLAGTRFEGGDGGEATFNHMARMLLPASLKGVVVDSRQTAWRRVADSLRNARVVLASGGAEMPAVRAHVKAGRDAVVVDRSGGGHRLMVGGEAIDLASLARDGGRRIDCTPEDIALAAAAALSMGYGADVIRLGLTGVNLAETGAAA